MSMSIILVWLVAINALTFFMYWWDKRQAIWRGPRVPEMTLLLVGFLGGSPAAFIAQRKFRHKTKKQPFQFIFWVLVILQIYLAFVYLQPPPPVPQALG